MASSTSKFAVGVIVGIAVVVAFCGCCVAGAVLLPFGFLGHGAAAGAARTFLKQDATVRREIGDIKSFGLFPSGRVSITSGQGRAHLIFRLDGSRARGRAVVDLAKAPGKEWVVKDALLVVGGRPFILKGNPPIPAPPEKPGEAPGGDRPVRQARMDLARTSP